MKQVALGNLQNPCQQKNHFDETFGYGILTPYMPGDDN